MEEKLKMIFFRLFNVPAQDFNFSLSNKNVAGWDSLKHMDLILSIEENFGIRLEADDIVKMTNVENITKILESKQVSA